MRIRTSRKIKYVETYGFQEKKFKLWRKQMKIHDLKVTPFNISENDLNTIKSERELILVLDELNR